MRIWLSSVVLASVALGRGSSLAAQADPPYLRDFPPVERVKQAMKVADPKETALRQLGAFYQLQQILKLLSGRREFSAFTPGEAKLIGEYNVAEYYTAQAADSAYPGPYGRLRKLTDSTPYRYSRIDPRFGVEGIEVFKTLLTPAVQAQYDQVAGVNRSRYVAKIRADSAAAANGGRVVVSEAPPPAQGQHQKRTQRCLESGRSQADCLGEGLSSGWRELVGDFSELFPKTVGLRLVGTWPGPGKFLLDFGLDNVTLNCGDLIPTTVEYTLAHRADGLRVTVATAKTSMTFVVGDGAALAGPAAADIAGQIIVGYEPGVRTYADGRQEAISRPIYRDVTRRCPIGVLAVSSPTTSLGAGSSSPFLDALSGGLDRITQQVPTGLRMAGQYRGGDGLDLNFLPEGVVVNCDDVGSLRPYRIQTRGGQTTIVVENGGSPFTMTLGAEGGLRGSGTVRVDGRRFMGKGPNGELTFAPKTASCPLGSLAPVTGRGS